MLLSDLKKNETAIIKKISANDELKKRLYSFGISKGAKIKIEAISAGNKVYEVNVDDTLVAIRKEEANCIEVEYE